MESLGTLFYEPLWLFVRSELAGAALDALRGRKVSIVSTMASQPPMISDDLRRQADHFIDLTSLKNEVGRDPSERPVRRPEPADAEKGVAQDEQRPAVTDDGQGAGDGAGQVADVAPPHRGRDNRFQIRTESRARGVLPPSRSPVVRRSHS